MSRLSRCRERVAELEAALAECVARRDALGIENANLTTDVARLTADLTAVLEELHVANVNRAEARAKIVDLTEQVTALKKELADCQNPPQPPPPPDGTLFGVTVTGPKPVVRSGSRWAMPR